jgi:putative peptide zinc metalloprotease protein
MESTATLPSLREELELLPGPHTPEGQPTWTLHDPVRNLYFQLLWPSFEILSRWHLADPQAIVEAIRTETCLEIGIGDIESLAEFVVQNQLGIPAPGTAGQFAVMLEKRRGNLGQWLLHNYLFFRVPLIKPDRWLTAWAGRLDFFYSRLFFQLTLVAALLGLASIYREWDHYSATLVDLFSWEGAVAYGITLTGVKVLHELGHGFTAKRHGCRVPTMGVAFLVLWPVAYTDTNEVWKLTRRDQRVQVAAAGIATELIIAAWATLAWMWLPEGGLKTVAFLLSSTTWVSTLVINASPFMRFDGYFLLADYLRIPNLHGRAFALARWDLRERLFALGEAVPERFSPWRHAGLILFAWATWIYRLVLFLGIAVLVYHFFIKVVGILLFIVEIVWFVSLPAWQELKVWRANWPQIIQSQRGRRSLVLGAMAFLVFALPWPTRIHGAGLLKPVTEQVLYAPEHGQIEVLPVANGIAVRSGDVLLGMASPDIASRTGLATARTERLAWQSASAGFDVEQKKDWQVLNEQLAIAEAEKGTVVADSVQYRSISMLAGTLRDMDPDLRPANWLVNQELLGRVVGEGAYQAIAYVDEEDVRRISVGDRALFLADGMAGPAVHLEIAAIDQDASRTLGEGELASMFGGTVLVREKNGVLIPERGVYRVLLTSRDPVKASQHRWRGQVSIAGNWEAPGLRFLRYALSIFWREAGF